MDDSVESAYRELEELIQAYLSPGELALVARAYRRARAAHGGARRKSGEPYITHPLAVAGMLAHMRMDAATLAAALLHDVLEDTPVSAEELAQEFGQEIFSLVDGLTKVGKVRQLADAQPTYSQLEQATLVNLFMAMAADLRVIVVKLCDRYHNLLTIDALKPQRRVEIAQETLDLFAPVAARLGIWIIKKQLEDQSLRILDPDAFAEIEQMQQARSRLVQRDLQDALASLRIKLADAGISARVDALPEQHIYGLYLHIQEHGQESARAYDSLRLQVVTETLQDCYTALSSVHSLWQPVYGRVVDYIAAPKDGLYRSLHTIVIGTRGYMLEVRIRTRQMEHVSNYGIVAYLQHPLDDAWASQPPPVAWLKQLDKLPGDDPQAFLDIFKSSIAPDHVRVFTPHGDGIELPIGSTPVDFAYAVHTEIGHSCHRALVNNRFVPLNTPLQNGDQVEIVKTLTPRPERAWLDVDLGYVGNHNTLGMIRRWFAHQPEEDILEQGRALIEKEIQCWGACVGWSSEDIKRLARKRGLDARSLCLRVGRGEISAGELAALVLCEVSGLVDGQPAQVTLEINAADRPGLLRDACQIVAEDNVNLESASGRSSDENELARLHLTLTARRIRQIVRITHRLEHLPSVIRVRCIQLPPRREPAAPEPPDSSS